MAPYDPSEGGGGTPLGELVAAIVAALPCPTASDQVEAETGAICDQAC